MSRDEWSSIDDAPKDRRILLYYDPPIFNGISIIAGRYDADEHSKYPKAFWSHDLHLLAGVRAARANPPKKWRDLPLDPQGRDSTSIKKR